MINYTFRQYVFTAVIISAIAVGVFIVLSKEKNDLESIFLRIYIGTTVHTYVDYSLENASAITSQIINNKRTVMYIHGFTENVEKESVQIVVQAYLKRNDHNVIAVDYGKLANNMYINVTKSTPKIAEALATALDQMNNSGFDTEKLHIVGHSLGGQIAGYIGRKVSFLIPRITGLDPAGPSFKFVHPSLSSSDARFVDIIHTDYGCYGAAKSTGTVDFFPNGGKRIQPGCPKHPKVYSKEDFCSHHRSWRFYAESLNSVDESTFLGVQCPSSSDFTSGKCYNNTQIIMGYATPNNAQGTVYLVTNDASPFGLGEQGIISTTPC